MSEPQPGVMHPVDEAFYNLAIKERDFARVQATRLEAEVKRLRSENEWLHRQLRPAKQAADQWCPVCKTHHVDVGEATDAGLITRACPRVATDDPRYYGSPVYTGDR